MECESVIISSLDPIVKVGTKRRGVKAPRGMLVGHLLLGGGDGQWPLSPFRARTSLADCVTLRYVLLGK